jgi:hypothetical protein
METIGFVYENCTVRFDINPHRAATVTLEHAFEPSDADSAA